MKALYALLIAFFLTGCSTWSNEEKALYGVLVASQGYDLIQTNQINDNPDKAEGNPLFARGNRVNVPLVAVAKAAFLGFTYWHMDRHPNQRKWLYLLDGISLGIVIHNEEALK